MADFEEDEDFGEDYAGETLPTEDEEVERHPIGVPFFRGDKLWVFDKTHGLMLMGNPITISEILSEFETGKVLITVKFPYQGRERTETVTRKTLSASLLPELVDYGADCFPDVAKHYSHYLRDQEEAAERRNIHRGVGWGVFEGRRIFRHFGAVGVVSQYAGDQYEIEPSGDFESWKRLVEEEVLGNPWLELALAVGLSSALIGLLASRTYIDSVIFHIYGRSGTGKTTATRLAVSPWGLPDKAGAGLIKTWDGSEVSLLSHFRDNFGVAVGLDEASVQDAKEPFSTIIYRIAMGRDRTRLHTDASRKTTAEWATTIISNGEVSLLQGSSKNLGIRARLVEATTEKWTVDGEHSERLADGLLDHYGHAGPQLVEQIMATGEDAVFDLWKGWSEHLRERMAVRDELSQRVSKKLGLIVATAALANAGLDLSLDLDVLQETLLAIEAKAQRERAEWQRAYDSFHHAFTANQGKFLTGPQARHSGAIWGRLPEGKENVVWVLVESFVEIMHKVGYKNLDPILKEWKWRGILIAEPDRQVVERKVGNSPHASVYIIRLDFGEDEATGEFAPAAQKKPDPKVGKRGPVKKARESGE